MKKLVLMFAAIAAISFASCTPKAADTDADVVTADEMDITDSLTVDLDAEADSIAIDSVN